MTTHARTARILGTAALATALVGSAGIGAGTAQAAPQAPAASTAMVLGRTSIDMDGDGRADRTTLTKVRRTTSAYTMRLTTRTAKGRTFSTLVKAPGYMDDTHAKNIWTGATGIDGVRGGEIVLDLNGGFGDATGFVVYTVRNGKHTLLKAPGARSTRTAWNVSSFPGIEAGYQFSMRKGVRYVTATQVESWTRDGNVIVRSDATRTTYRWGRTGWMKSGTVVLKDITREQAHNWAGFDGLNWR